jgi:hypothetical protein
MFVPKDNIAYKKYQDLRIIVPYTGKPPALQVGNGSVGEEEMLRRTYGDPHRRIHHQAWEWVKVNTGENEQNQSER